MKAVVQVGYGPPDVLRLKEVAKPPVGDGDVLVRVRAAGVNAGDTFIMKGRPFPVRMAFGLRKPKNERIAGWDLAGEVEAVGANVTDFRPGDRVFGESDSTRGGSFAEYACSQTDRLAPMPANLTFEQAAAVPVAGVTALRGLRDQGKVQPGQKVLVNGASGGVGTFAVQIAKALGAEVTGVCSAKNVDLVCSAGADHVIDYTQEDFTRGEQRYDLIFDNVGSHPFTHYRRVLTPQGLILPNTGHAGLGYLIKALALPAFSRRQGRMFSGTPNQADLLVLKELIESGRVTPVIDRTYPLSQAPAAVGYVGEGHARGKVVITAEALAPAAEAPTAPVAPEPKRSKTERFWDRIAPSFDVQPKGPDEDVGKALTRTRPYLDAGDTVLDYGCATGHVALRIAADVKAVYGIDISSKMIAIAKQKAGDRKVTNVHFSHSTIFDEEHEPGSFDVVLAFSILHLLEDVQRVMYRIAELLKPGGLFVSVTPCLGEKRTWASRGVRAGIRLLSRVGILPYVGVYEVIGLQNTLAAAGLVAVEIAELEPSSAVHLIAARRPVVPWYK